MVKKILVDIGNSFTDYLVVGEKIILGKIETKKFDILYKKYEREKFYISCVVKEIESKYSIYKNVKFIKYKDLSKLFKIKYYVLEPNHVLGTDRMLNILAAKQLFGNNIVVISLGTCLVMDYLNKKGEYVGGEIFPGIKLITKSLVENTSQLKNVNFKVSKMVVGKNTNDCIINAINNFYLSGITNFIKVVKPKKIVLTGGGCEILKRMFLKKYKTKIFVIKNLVLLGISYFCCLKNFLVLDECVRINNYFKVNKLLKKELF
jgi:type III pantothenate kinase